MYSHNIDGKVFDYRFKKLGISDVNGYSFSLVGSNIDKTILVGTIYKDCLGWTCVPWHSDKYNKICPIYGLKTRLNAAALLIKLCEL